MPKESSDASTEALELIRTWEPKKDVWAFTHGPVVLSVGTLASSLYINRFVRKALKMKTYAFMTTYMATCMPPAALAPILHGLFVVEPLITGRVSCPVCTETKSSLIQVAVGFVYPLILAPFAASQFAERYMTSHVPNIAKPKEYFMHLSKMFKPIKTPLLGILALQVVIGGALSHWENYTIYDILEKVQRMEDVLKRNQSPEYMEELKEKSSIIDNSVVMSERKRKYGVDIEQ